MSELKDPAIKLFGRTIQLPPPDGGGATAVFTAAAASPPPPHQHHKSNSSAITTTEDDNNKKPLEEVPDREQEDGSSHQISEDATEPATPSGINDEPKTPDAEKENSIPPNNTKNEDQNETTTSHEKTLKKPDKILPCPRCNSMDTKFCYYNNYNVNQPRHFCKNCQRYWTAGGTMRNVPVGSGRRKNKHSSASHYRHLMISEALQAARADGAKGIHQPTLRTNGTTFTFGSDGTLCESMASALKLAETPKNGFHGPEQSVLIPCRIIENGDDHSSGSSSTTSISTEKGGNVSLHEPISKNIHGFAAQVPLFPGPTWPCNWNSTQWTSPMPPTPFAPPGFPVSFYPTPPYWGCPLPSPWNMPMPWLPQAPSSPDATVLRSSPTSQTLGKHARDENMLKPINLDKEEPSSKNDSERGIWIPKTLRIDDPSEAAKSSIWSTLGINNENADSGNRFRAFQPKSDEKNHIDHSSELLQANPAALSRSLNFREST